jgi:hypothetical protein
MKNASSRAFVARWRTRALTDALRSTIREASMPSASRTVPLAAALLALSSVVAHAQEIIISYGIDFVTVGDPGNPPYAGGGPFNRPENIGRGGVGYEYRIAKNEVTTGQWLEFVNTFAPNSVGTPWEGIGDGLRWGGVRRFLPGPNGELYRLQDESIPHIAEVPVLNIPWRHAAMYVNWLHHDKAPSTDAILSGVYEVSTFGVDENGSITDQATRSEDARFWIPSLDEQYKAFYYDPAKFGPNEAGWWQYPNRSDELPVQAGPGEGNSNAGLGSVLHNPVGSYPDAQSPWGLLDTSGGASEWSEEFFVDLITGRRLGRASKGSNLVFPQPNMPFDLAIVDGIEFPSSGAHPDTGIGTGLRIAALVPAPGSTFLGLVVALTIARRRRGRSIDGWP